MGRAPEETSSRRHRKSVRFLNEAKALGGRVRKLRLEREWTLETAAEHMDLDLKHLQKIESGSPPLNVTLVTLVRIAEAFELPTLAGLFQHKRSRTTR